MVHFGRVLREKRLAKWENYYLGYKQMKKRIKLYLQLSPTTSPESRDDMLKEFSEILDYQVEKIVLFLLAQEGHLASRLIELREQREEILSIGRRRWSEVAEEAAEAGTTTRSTGAGRSPGITAGAVSLGTRPTVLAEERRRQYANLVGDLVEFHEALEGVPDLVCEYRKVGQDLLELLEFVNLNAVALRKILKKFDKQLGYRLTDRYIYTRSNHPYSQLLHVFRHVGIGAMVATLSRNLAELRARRLTPMSISLYDESGQSWLPKSVKNEPIIKAIEEAEERLMQATGFLKYLAEGSLICAPPEEAEAEEEAGELEEGREGDLLTLSLNLLNTFLYMVNYYIVLPTADKYAMQLGADSTLCGVIIGSMALASLFSSLVYSAWSNRSYFSPLVLSTLILVLGNLMYAVALDFDSVWLVLLGRLLCGLGGARAINRRYIADCVATKRRTAASAAFVSASALGMSVGPAISGVLQMDMKIMHRWTFNFVTAPGWVMCLCWLMYFVVLWFGFKEPPRPFLANAKTGNKGGGSERDDAEGAKTAATGGSDETRALVTAVSETVVEVTLVDKSTYNPPPPPFDKKDGTTLAAGGEHTSTTAAERMTDEERGFSFWRVASADVARNGSLSGAVGAWRATAAAAAGGRGGGCGALVGWEDISEQDAGGGVLQGNGGDGGVADGRGGRDWRSLEGENSQQQQQQQEGELVRTRRDLASRRGSSELEEPLLLKAERGEREQEACSFKEEMDGEGGSGAAGRELESEDTESEDGGDKEGFWANMAEMTVPVRVNLFIYFVLKFAVEMVLSEASVVTAYYFGWGMEEVALFLSLLGITVLPINFVIGSYISNVFEDRYIMLWAEIITAVGIVMCVSLEPVGLRYTVLQYVSGAMVVFVSCQVLEGVNLSLMSKVMSEKLARGTFNCGLLSTEAGTSARVVSDLLISFAGSQGVGMTALLNITMMITLVLTAWGIRMTIAVLNFLF